MTEIIVFRVSKPTLALLDLTLAGANIDGTGLAAKERSSVRCYLICITKIF